MYKITKNKKNKAYYIDVPLSWSDLMVLKTKYQKNVDQIDETLITLNKYFNKLNEYIEKIEKNENKRNKKHN